MAHSHQHTNSSRRLSRGRSRVRWISAGVGAALSFCAQAAGHPFITSADAQILIPLSLDALPSTLIFPIRQIKPYNKSTDQLW